ncbi:MAG: tRNA (adenosine(37)-N6)-threonylcarbamoyltransferase complex ATPase subunit type 1 TsaE [Gammaproteobacteria bacterium]|nr:tRNA (adenosine(37)-N6)-threonylcarbamoyltransferase complex ATPase subunit type 1 TsaE [Gammaproteobacteria bacterium]
MNVRHYIPEESEMSSLAQELVSAFRYPEVVYLHGELGAGKTTLVREILRILGHSGAVKSPTYTLYETYQLAATEKHSSLTAQHFDLYRLTDPDELEYIGIRDLLDADLILVEWPERGDGHLPEATISIDIQYANTRANEGALADNSPGQRTEIHGRDVMITRLE